MFKPISWISRLVLHSLPPTLAPATGPSFLCVVTITSTTTWENGRAKVRSCNTSAAVPQQSVLDSSSRRVQRSILVFSPTHANWLTDVPSR
ncbi:hypothetical protein F4604DRAFT_1768333, partial [Suillus subluteus]